MGGFVVRAATVATVCLAAVAGVPAGAATAYLGAPFDGAADNTGSGPEATGGPWDPAGVVTGTGFITNHGTTISAFVDPSAGLEGSTKGFRFRDTSDRSLLLTLIADPAVTAPSQTTPFWVEYSFQLDPAVAVQSDALVHFTVYDTMGTDPLVKVSIGENAAGEFRYKIYNFNGVNVFSDLGSYTAGDTWRVLIRCNPATSEHTHWIWKNGDTMSGSVLDTAHTYFGPQTGPVDRTIFQTDWAKSVEYVIDELTIADAGPPTAPVELEATPTGPGDIELTWNDVSSDEDGFVIERSTTGTGGWSFLVQTAANATSFTDSGLTAKTRYWYRVAATNAEGSSSWAGPTSAVAVYTGKPLSDWIDVTSFGANGSDIFDDTAAIQMALDSLEGDWAAATPQVLWFPNGTYRISDADMDGTGLLLERSISGVPANHNGLQIIGESPGGVIMQWSDTGGSPGAPKVLIHNNGNPRCIWRNFVWDGGGKMNDVIAFDQSSIAVPAGWNDSATAHYDSTFRNAHIGFRIGHYNKQNSEMTLRRNRFINNEAGVSVEDFNALNIWIWDCEFDNNDEGVSNAFAAGGSGDFRVIRGRFTNSSIVDVRMGNTGDFTIRECWSTGSQRFFDTSLSTASSRTTLIGNRISGYTATDGHAIRLKSAGAFLLIDNEISSPGPGSKPVFATAPGGALFPTVYKTSVVAMHNTYTVVAPYETTAWMGNPCCKLLNVDDQVTGPFSVTPPPLPVPVDPFAGRNIYTATDGANLKDTVAAALADPSPAAVHLPNGDYRIDQTIPIPQGSDLIISGNGQTTRVLWQGAPGGTMFDIDGFQAGGLTVRDVELHGAGLATALLVRDVNQDDSRMFLNKVSVTNPATGVSDAGVVVDRADRTEVVLMDSGFDGGMLGPTGQCDGPRSVGMRVIGGPQPQTGTFVWTGSSAGNDWNFDIVNGPSGVRTLVSSFYQEKTAHYARVRGSAGGGATDGIGEVTLHGGKMAGLCDALTNAVSVENFTGNVGVVSDSIFDSDGDGARIEQSGGSVAIQSIANSVYEDPDYVVDAGGTISRAGTQLICQELGGKPTQMPPCLDPMDPSNVGTMPTADINVDPMRLDDAVRLLRIHAPPGFYDEPGAPATWQMNFDNVRIVDPLSGLVLSGGIPLAPVSLQATAVSGGQIDLSWTDGSTDEDRFRIERSLTSGSGFASIGATLPNVTTFSDSTVVTGTQYFYRVAADRDRTGSSAWSNESSATTSTPGGVPDGGGVPGVPLTVAPNATVPTDVDLSWGTSCNPQGMDYAVYEGAIGDFTSHAPATCSTGGATQATVAPAAGGRYWLVVPLSGTIEGSYGSATAGPRPRSTAACVPGFETGGC